MKGTVECSCAVCTAHRLRPESPEHVQQTQLRLEHASKARARRRAPMVWCLTVAVLLVAAVYAFHV
jgi:hypothetical protein